MLTEPDACLTDDELAAWLSGALSEHDRTRIIAPDAERGALDPQCSVTTAAGTPAYMAPELFRGAAASERSDQFAFAGTAWQTLFDEHPFAAPSIRALLEHIERKCRSRSTQTSPRTGRCGSW